jgi:YidC/Oxa1 family membrane protein insertase
VLAPQPASAAPAVQTTFDATDATASAVAAPPPLAPAPAADLAASAIPPPADLSAAPSLPGVEALLSDVPALLEPGALSALGLSHGFPSGWATAALDYLHLTLALSWPGTILAACVLARAPLAVLQVSSLRTSARLQQFARPLDALRTEASAARARGDRIRMQLAALRYQKLQERTGVGYAGVLKIAGVGIVNIPVTLGLFLAVRRLAGLPLPEMAASAWAWIPSLTAPDPLYLLPLANAFIMQLSLSVRSLALPSASELG